jgi:hypothetical protein
MKSEPTEPRAISDTAEECIKEVTKNIKDRKMAETAKGMMRSAFNGNTEIAGIMSRMIRAELDARTQSGK